MAEPIQFVLTTEHMARFLTWRSAVEAEIGLPVEGVLFSLLITRHGNRQIIVRPSTEHDCKLKHIPRTDGTYDTFVPHEEVLAAYDNFGFADTPVLWPALGIRLHLCYGPLLERGEIPRCYVEWLDEPHWPLVPFQVSDQPGLLEQDELRTVFPSPPLPPAVLQRMQDFIRVNVTVLLQHWHGEIDSGALLDALQLPGGPSETEESPPLYR